MKQFILPLLAYILMGGMTAQAGYTLAYTTPSSTETLDLEFYNSTDRQETAYGNLTMAQLSINSNIFTYSLEVVGPAPLGPSETLSFSNFAQSSAMPAGFNSAAAAYMTTIYDKIGNIMAGTALDSAMKNLGLPVTGLNYAEEQAAVQLGLWDLSIDSSATTLPSSVYGIKQSGVYYLVNSFGSSYNYFAVIGTDAELVGNLTLALLQLAQTDSTGPADANDLYVVPNKGVGNDPTYQGLLVSQADFLPPSSSPEPASALLFALGVGGMGWFCRRRSACSLK